MSMTEILNELPQLDDGERQTLLHRLLTLGGEPKIQSLPHGHGARVPNPVAALFFAREHGLEEGSTDEWMKMLRQGEED